MERYEIEEQLQTLADASYARFAQGLLPGVEGIRGVRLPALRRLAARVARGDWRKYLQSAPDGSFEDKLLRGMVIGCAKMDLEERLRHVADFVPTIDNWSVCDSFCCGLKAAREDAARVWAFVLPYLDDPRPFCARFAVVMLLTYFNDDAHIDSVLPLLCGVRHEAYYLRMAVGWALSMCYARFPDKTLPYLAQGELDEQTRGIAIRKIQESRQIDPQRKAEARAAARQNKS